MNISKCTCLILFSTEPQQTKNKRIDFKQSNNTPCSKKKIIIEFKNFAHEFYF